MTSPATVSERAEAIARKVQRFVRNLVAPYELDPRRTEHGPRDELVDELRRLAADAGVLTPHILPDGSHLSQRETALVLRMTGLSPLGPLACNTAAPDQGNMYLLGKVGSAEQVFREVRTFRIYDGPTEVHKWSLAKKIRREWRLAHGH